MLDLQSVFDKLLLRKWSSCLSDYFNFNRFLKNYDAERGSLFLKVFEKGYNDHCMVDLPLILLNPSKD